jgi:hypothetical protein
LTGFVDFLFNIRKKVAQALSRKNLPGTLKGGKLIIDENAFSHSGRGVGVKKKKQTGKGLSPIYSKREPHKPRDLPPRRDLIC